MQNLLALAAGLMVGSYSPRLPFVNEWLFVAALIVSLHVITAWLQWRGAANLNHLQAASLHHLNPLSSPFIFKQPTHKPSRAVFLLTAFLLGSCWSLGYGQKLISAQIDESLIGTNILVTGTVTNLPTYESDRTRFFFTVDSASVQDAPIDNSILPQYLRLSWYARYSDDGVPLLLPGDRWQLLVRLKPPRGLVNPGGFDYKRWLLARGVSATGYVRNDKQNRHLVAESRFSIDRWRYKLKQRLMNEVSQPASALLLALALGDKSEVEQDVWNLLQATGTVHLLAISGLHIGLLAAVGYWFGAGVCRLIAIVYPYQVYSRFGGMLCALIFGFLYALLAGFSLPTQRAVIMLVVGVLFFCSGRVRSVWLAWLLALCLCLLINPLASFESGYWLSFGAVAALIIVFGSPSKTESSIVFDKILALLKAQWAVFVGLFLVLCVLGLPISLLAPIVNVVAIAWVGFLVVPTLLLGCSLLLFSTSAAAALWHVSASSLEIFISALQWVSSIVDSEFYLFHTQASPSLSVIGIVGLASLLLLIPKLKYKSFLVLAFLPLWLVRPEEKPLLHLTFLDVGQGVALLVEAGDYTLLYDTGPSWGGRQSSNSKVVGAPKSNSAAKSVILPFLQSRGINSVDTLIISHGDNDHQGGAEYLKQNLEIKQWFAGELDRLPAGITASSCHGQYWQSQAIKFSILPFIADGRDKSNNRSCVLLIEAWGKRALIPGDIEKDREYTLLMQPDLSQLSNTTTGLLSGVKDTRMKVDLLLAPHHGSQTSSSVKFVQQLQPQWVVVSAGYMNRYNHPHPRVISRYEATGAQILSTGNSGAVLVEWGAGSDLKVSSARAESGRYWHR